jgi:4-nitrophenyl phosphatase
LTAAPEASSSAGPGPVICCDLDGVIWRGDQAIPGSADAIRQLRAHGLRVAFLTNNSSATVQQYLDRLGNAGIDAPADDLCTSAQAAAALLSADLPHGSDVIACAGAGVVEALTEAGFTIVEQPPARAVVVGWHRTFDFDALTRAADAVRAGARFVATNLDPTFPVAGGLLPGAGALVAAVATASGRRPDVAGKPELPMVRLVHERYGLHGVVVGDRPSTDGALAAALGWPFALVLSGVAGSPGEESIPDPAPRFVGADLAHVTPELIAALSQVAP